MNCYKIKAINHGVCEEERYAPNKHFLELFLDELKNVKSINEIRVFKIRNQTTKLKSLHKRLSETRFWEDEKFDY